MCNGILLSHKKNEVIPFVATRMDLEIFILSEVSQTEKKIPCIIDKQDLRKIIQMNLFTKQKQTHRQKKINLWLSKGKEQGRDKLGVWDYHIHTAIHKTGK